MYLMYVDESGDVGKINSPTNYFILSAIVVHECYWNILLGSLIKLKSSFKEKYGLLLKEEIHASVFLQKRLKLKNQISRNLRLDLLKKCLDWLNEMQGVSVITVRIDKSKVDDPFEYAWKALIQRFDNTLSYNNFPLANDTADMGIIMSDNTDSKKLTSLLRKMRKINMVSNDKIIKEGNRNLPIEFIIADPVFLDSKFSFFLQIVDVVAYFARQVYEPNKFVRQKGAKGFYGRLDKVINKHATKKSNNFYIVEL